VAGYRRIREGLFSFFTHFTDTAEYTIK